MRRRSRCHPKVADSPSDESPQRSAGAVAPIRLASSRLHPTWRHTGQGNGNVSEPDFDWAVTNLGNASVLIQVDDALVLTDPFFGCSRGISDPAVFGPRRPARTHRCRREPLGPGPLGDRSAGELPAPPNDRRVRRRREHGRKRPGGGFPPRRDADMGRTPKADRHSRTRSRPRARCRRRDAHQQLRDQLLSRSNLLRRRGARCRHW